MASICAAYTDSKRPAAPMPVPMHIVTIPYFCPRRRRPWTMVAVRTAPVAPSGCPSAIALGHPLGATGAIRTATIVHGLKRRQQKYGMVTMCIGTGMGAAGIFEAV